MKHEATANILAAVRLVLSGSIYLSEAMHLRLAQKAATPSHSGAMPIASLSQREFEILHLIGLGFGTRQISAKLNRSIKTVEAHRANLKEKLQLKSGADLVRFAAQWTEER
jgi:DNA-binding NarL/FixJ family response regulator